MWLFNLRKKLNLSMVIFLVSILFFLTSIAFQIIDSLWFTNKIWGIFIFAIFIIIFLEWIIIKLKYEPSLNSKDKSNGNRKKIIRDFIKGQYLTFSILFGFLLSLCFMIMEFDKVWFEKISLGFLSIRKKIYMTTGIFLLIIISRYVLNSISKYNFYFYLVQITTLIFILLLNLVLILFAFVLKDPFAFLILIGLFIFLSFAGFILWIRKNVKRD